MSSCSLLKLAGFDRHRKHRRPNQRDDAYRTATEQQSFSLPQLYSRGLKHCPPGAVPPFSLADSNAQDQQRRRKQRRAMVDRRISSHLSIADGATVRRYGVAIEKLRAVAPEYRTAFCRKHGIALELVQDVVSRPHPRSHSCAPVVQQRPAAVSRLCPGPGSVLPRVQRSLALHPQRHPQLCDTSNLVKRRTRTHPGAIRQANQLMHVESQVPHSVTVTERESHRGDVVGSAISAVSILKNAQLDGLVTAAELAGNSVSLNNTGTAASCFRGLGAQAALAVHLAGMMWNHQLESATGSEEWLLGALAQVEQTLLNAAELSEVFTEQPMSGVRVCWGRRTQDAALVQWSPRTECSLLLLSAT